MKAVPFVGTTALFLFLGFATPAFGQDEKAKPAQHEEQAKPAKQEAQAKPAKQAAQAKPEARQAQAKQQVPQSKPAQPKQQAKPEKQQQPAKSNGHGAPERTAAQQQRQRSQPALRLSVRGQGRIPEDRYRANFGEGHTFVINQPVMVGGFSRFQYGGFWFGFVSPWPADWYYTDDVYVDYIDGGYYLYNPYYPGARVSISVVL